MAEMTATVAETRANFSKIAATVRETGRPVTVFKNSKPWVLVAPIESGYGDHIPSIDWAKQDVARADPETRRTILPADWDDEEATGSTMPSHDLLEEGHEHAQRGPRYDDEDGEEGRL